MTAYDILRARVTRTALALAQGNDKEALWESREIDNELVESRLVGSHYAQVAALHYATRGTVLLLGGAYEGAAQCLKLALINSDRLSLEKSPELPTTSVLQPKVLKPYIRLALVVLAYERAEGANLQSLADMLGIALSELKSNNLRRESNQTCHNLLARVTSLRAIIAQRLDSPKTRVVQEQVISALVEIGQADESPGLNDLRRHIVVPPETRESFSWTAQLREMFGEVAQS